MTSTRLGGTESESLSRFARGPTTADRAEALTSMLSRKELLRATRTEEFRAGLHGLLEGFESAASDEDRLAALVQLVRIAQSAKPLSAEVRKSLEPPLALPLPAVKLLREADSRGYVAKACSWSAGNWVTPYAAQAIADEETAEKVRAEFMSVLFDRQDTLAEILRSIDGALRAVDPGTELPAESIAKRITRILAAFRERVVLSVAPPGTDLGAALGQFVRNPFARFGLATDQVTCVALAREIILCTHDIVRTRFSVSTDSDMYTGIRFAKDLVAKPLWPPELHEDLELVAGSLLEALLLLAKQGITAPSLALHLELVTGNRERAEHLMREMSDQHPEIPEAVRAWLKKERLSDISGDKGALLASRELRGDSAVGQVLVESGRVDGALDVLTAQVIPALQMYDPALIPPIDALVKRVKVLVQEIQDMARGRKLGLLGDPGAETDFAPKYFESMRGIAGQRVRVVTPAVVRLREDGSPGDVVIKGLVE